MLIGIGTLLGHLRESTRPLVSCLETADPANVGEISCGNSATTQLQYNVLSCLLAGHYPAWDWQCCEFDIDSIFSYSSLIQRSVLVILSCIGGMIISTKGAVRRPMTYDDHQSNQTPSNPTKPLNELHKPQVERRTTSNELI